MPDGGVRGGGGLGVPGGARDGGAPDGGDAEATRPNEALGDEPPGSAGRHPDDGDRYEDRYEDRGDGDPGGEDWDGEDWDPDDEAEWERSQELARRKRLRRVRRQRVVFLLVVLLVLAIGAGAAMVVTGRWQLDLDPGAAPAKPACSAPALPVAAPAEVQVRVLNSTDRRGLAGGVAEELRRRGFAVTEVGNSGGEPVPESAQVVFPPPAAPAARALATRVPGAVLREDPAAPGVALVLGRAYEQLAPEEALVPVPAPAPPSGCAPAPAP